MPKHVTKSRTSKTKRPGSAGFQPAPRGFTARFVERVTPASYQGWLAVLGAAVLLVLLAVIALGRRPADRFQRIFSLSGPVPRLLPSVQGPQTSSNGGGYYAALTVQPDADKVGRALGLRFQASGKEVTTITGALSLGSDQHSVQMSRTQTASGEVLTVTIDNRPPMTWSYAAGGVESGTKATGQDLAILERLALDSADEFVISQLRGCSYMAVGRQVRPASAGDSDSYEGPVWDLIRLGQPRTSGSYQPVSNYRLYYVNSATGLIDQVISNENSQVVTAALSNWSIQSGERFPAKVGWSIAGQSVMTLSVTGISFTAK